MMHVTKDSFTKLLVSVQFFYVFSRFFANQTKLSPSCAFSFEEIACERKLG